MRFLLLFLLFPLFTVAQPVGSFMLHTPAAGANPYTHSYSIITDHTQCGTANTSSFCVLVSYTATALKDVAHGGSVQNTTTFNGQTVPADVVFSAYSNYSTLYNAWDFESWDNVNGAINVWVPLAVLSNTNDSTMYMGVGKLATTTYQGGSVGAAWPSQFIGVWHFMNGTTLSALDATTHANNGSITSAAAASGNIDGCASFNGSASINVGSSLTASLSTRTFQAWVNATSFANAYNSVISLYEQSPDVFTILVKSNGKLALYVDCTHYDGTGSTTLSSGTWYHIVMTYDATIGLKGYINGSVDGSASGCGALQNHGLTQVNIGNHPSISGRNWNGSIDETRVRNDVEASSEVTSEYNNQKSGSTFLTITNIY